MNVVSIPEPGARQVDLDDLGRAGPHQEQLPDVRPPRQKPGDLTVKLGIGIRQTRQILLFENRRPEPGFGKDHHARRRLQKVRAGAAAHDQEERVLHLAVQPDDPGQPAEHLALAAFLQNGRVAATAGRGVQAHAATPSFAAI